MKQRFTLFLLMVLSCAITFAGPVDIEQARAKAAKFLKEQHGSSIVLTETPEYAPARSIKGVATNSDTPAYYVFNAENENGYVIVSGDDRTEEILGYATNGSFDMDNMPENVKAWLQGYTEQIAMLETYVPQQQNTAQYTSQWTAIAPLTKTKWNQDAPYNNQCPISSNSSRSVTGCTATAMAQVMKYHEWPQAATSAIPAYTTASLKLSVPRLSATTFRWDEMKNTYNNGENGSAVAELMRYCGQSIKSDYSHLSTGAYTGDVVIALQKYFGYDQNIEMTNLAFHTISEWETLIYNELKEARPVYHAGYSMGGGHAFVCDGYDGNGMFHFNWGWGGSYDGYYKLVLLNPETGGIGSGSSDGYSNGQEIIIGIQAPTGEAAKPKYFHPHSEQVINNVMYSFFYNTHAETLTANVGFATIDVNNNIVKLLKDCGPMTLQGGLSESKWVGLDLASDNIKLSARTYRIATVCRPSGATEWKRVGSAQNYFEVVISPTGSITKLTQHPIIDVALTSIKATGNKIAGVQQNISLELQNNGDEVYTNLYLFASLNNTKGEAASRTTVIMKKGESREFNLHFTPETYGTYNIWLSQSADGSTHILKDNIEISPAPSKPSNLSLVSCAPNTTEVSAEVKIKNNSTEGYYREIVAILFENLYNDGKLWGTEVLTLPGDITSGATKTFNFKFHGADSYSQCAILIGYYANHKDANYTQLGNYVWFTTGETPIESIEGSNILEGPVYRIDGAKVSKPVHNGIYISNGKVLITK